MTLHRQRQFLGIHAVAVVDDLDESAAAILERHVDARRTGIDGVFHQFLDRRCRALDDLAGGDAIDDVGREKANRHGRNATRTAAPSLSDGCAYSAGGTGSELATPAGWPSRRKRRASAW